MVMQRGGYGEGPLPIKENVGKKINQFQQALRHQSADEPYHQRVRGGGNNIGVKSFAEFPKPTGRVGHWRFPTGDG
jgi:hypothetical protein